MKEYSIYKLTSPTGKIYIGSTSRKPEYRWNKGKGYAGNNELSSDIQKYGWEEFQKDVIEKTFDREEAEQREAFWIAFYKSTNPIRGYNIRPGGAHSPTPDRTRIKMSISQRGKERDETYRRHISESKMGAKNGMFGKTGKLNAISREVIATSKTGEKMKFESMMIANKALKLPEGAFKNISACCYGRKKTAYGYFWSFSNDHKEQRIS